MNMTSPFYDTVVPDIGLQISPALTSGQRDSLLSSLIASLPQGADVRACAMDRSQRIGLWLRPPMNASEAADRERSLKRFALLDEGDTFSAFVSDHLLNELNGSAWSLHGSVVPAAGSALSVDLGPDRSVLRMLPVEILIPGRLKLAVSYRRFAAGPDGFISGGTWSLAERRPDVTIVPPAWINAEFPDLSCMAQLRLRGADLRPPLRVSWSAEGLVANPGARSTPILFNVQGARPAQVVPKAVAVCVTDSDGLTAEARVQVQVQVTWGGTLASAAVA
jgi:hypothetical protein